MTPVRFDVAIPRNTDVAYLALSPDGRQLAFIPEYARGQGSIWLRSLDSREARTLDGQLMAADVRATGSKLETEEPKPLFDLRREALEVSPDGSRFLAFVPVDTEPAPVTVVLNWGLEREE